MKRKRVPKMETTSKKMKITIKFEFSDLDRKIVAFHHGHLGGEKADKNAMEYFVHTEIDHALEFLGSYYLAHVQRMQQSEA